MQTLIWKTLSPAQQADVLTRPALNDEADIGAVVKEIIAAVRSRGDEALRELSQRFERAPREQLRVSDAEVMPPALDSVMTSRVPSRPPSPISVPSTPPRYSPSSESKPSPGYCASCAPNPSAGSASMSREAARRSPPP